MKQSKYCIIIILAFSLLSCSNLINSGDSDLSVRKISSLTNCEKSLIKSSNKFSINLFENSLEYDKDKNIFISPLSVSYALGMAYNGAAGETREVIHNVLQIEDIGLAEFNSNYKSLIDLLKNIDQEVEMEIANSVWYRQEFDIEKEFTDNLISYFDAQISGLDFSTKESVDIINNWVSDKTNGKIESIVSHPIDPLTIIYLINAIYFKGLWSISFDSSYTSRRTFYKNDNTEIKCDMMQSVEEYEYLETNIFKAVNIYYGDNHFCLTAFLPINNNDISTITEQLTSDKLNNWSNQFKQSKLILNFPKLKFSYNVNFNKILKNIGMSRAFDPRLADFSNIVPLNGLFIQNVIHKSFIELDETGTEAAAVTSISIGLTSDEPTPKQFNANHPFLFLIREVESNTILFTGAIFEPVWE